MERLRAILEGDDVIITSFPENLDNTDFCQGILVGQIVELFDPSLPSCAKRKEKSTLVCICRLVNAEAEVTDLKFRIVILHKGICNKILVEKDVFFIRNPKIIRSQCVSSILSFAVKLADITLIEPNIILNEQCPQNQEEGLPSRSIERVARRRILQPHRTDPNLRTIISLDNFPCISPIFYSEGTFTNGSIIELLSDEVCLGYCRVCDENYYYNEFIWRTYEDKRNPFSESPYCPKCDEDELITTTLMVFFDCSMNFQVEGSDEIEVLFHCRFGDNFLGIVPVDYASDNTVRGTFRFKAANLLRGSIKIGYNFILKGELHVALLVSVEPTVQSEMTYH